MTERRQGVITLKGNSMILIGPEVAVGDTAPDFTVVDISLRPVTLGDTAGKVRLIAAVPSLDMPVCDTMTRKSNEQVAELSDDVVVDTISMDLPFAQARWCGAAGIDNVRTLSDHQSRSFGESSGLLVDELKLLARAAYVIDRDGKITYRQIVPEATDEPHYEAALSAVRSLL